MYVQTSVLPVEDAATLVRSGAIVPRPSGGSRRSATRWAAQAAFALTPAVLLPEPPAAACRPSEAVTRMRLAAGLPVLIAVPNCVTPCPPVCVSVTLPDAL